MKYVCGMVTLKVTTKFCLQSSIVFEIQSFQKIFYHVRIILTFAMMW